MIIYNFFADFSSQIQIHVAPHRREWKFPFRCIWYMFYSLDPSRIIGGPRPIFKVPFQSPFSWFLVDSWNGLVLYIVFTKTTFKRECDHMRRNWFYPKPLGEPSKYNKIKAWQEAIKKLRYFPIFTSLHLTNLPTLQIWN